MEGGGHVNVEFKRRRYIFERYIINLEYTQLN